MDEELVYYDGPLVFTAHNFEDEKFLYFAVDEEETGYPHIVAKTNPDVIQRLLNNELTYLEVFLHGETSIHWGDYNVRPRDMKRIEYWENKNRPTYELIYYDGEKLPIEAAYEHVSDYKVNGLEG